MDLIPKLIYSLSRCEQTVDQSLIAGISTQQSILTPNSTMDQVLKSHKYHKPLDSTVIYVVISRSMLELISRIMNQQSNMQIGD